MTDQRWEVEIRVNGDSILTIASWGLAGVENIEDHADRVRACAEHLMSFIGTGEPTPCFGCGDDPEVTDCPLCQSEEG